MTRKNNFLNRLDKFSKDIETNNHKLRDILKNDGYTDAYKTEAKKVAATSTKKIGLDASKDLNRIIDDTIIEYNKLIDKNSHERMVDQGYQLGLQNLINAINSNILSNDDIQRVYDLYKDDVFAIKMINSAISKSSGSLMLLELPDNYKTIDTLNKLKSNIKTYVENPNKDTDLYLVGVGQFANEHLDDNMFCIEN